MTMARKPIQIDRDKLRAEVRKRLRPDAEKATNPSLLADVKLFEKASLAGEYYESFGVNSQNYRYGRDKMLVIARRTATTHQRKALAVAEGA